MRDTGRKEWEKATILIAEPEKALVDYLYFLALGKKSKLERLNLKNLSKKKIIRYSKMFNNKKLKRLLNSSL